MSELISLASQWSTPALLLGIFFRMGNMTAYLKYLDRRLQILEGVKVNKAKA